MTTTNQKAATEIQLVLRKDIAYPRSSEDAALLTKLGVSVKFVSVDFVPLLADYAARKNIKVRPIHFNVLEEKALENLKARWPYKSSVSSNADNQVTLYCPPTAEDKKKVKSVYLALVKFYKEHAINVKYQVRQGKDMNKVIFTMTEDPEVFVQKDD